MDLSVFRRKSALSLGGLLALTLGAGSVQATTYLSASATAATALTVTGVTCNTLTGPPATGQTFTVHAFGAPAGFSIVVGVVQSPGLKVTAPAAVTLTSTTNTAGITFTVNSTAGCSNANGVTANTLAAGANTIPVQLTQSLNSAAAVNDNTVTVTDTITAATSALVVAPVTVTCGYNSVGPVYVPGAPKTVSVTSAANLGTPFTVVPGTVSGSVITPGSLPSWLTLLPVIPSGTAGTNAVNFTAQAASGCGAFAGVTQTYALPISDAPAPPVTVVITLVSTTSSPLTVTPVPSAPTISMTYVLNSNTAQNTTVNVLSSISTPSAQTYYQTTNLPIWLTVNYPTGYIPVTTGKNLTFSTTTAANSLAPGSYAATVFLTVAQYADTPVVINLLVTNAAPKLSVTSPNPQPVSYTLGGATPITTITVASSDSPIPYSMSFAGPLAPMLTAGEEATGIAYSFGSNINITYSPLLFQTSAPGTVISGTVTFTWGPTNSVTVVTLNLTVSSPAATLTSISPASLPTAAPGSVFYVTLTGNGFVGGTDPTLATKVGIVSGAAPGTLSPDTNLALTFVNSSNLLLKITVPALGAGGVNGDANLPFLLGGAGGPVYLGIANGSSTIPSGTATLTIGGGPIIYGVTSSSSFAEVPAGTLPPIAPYDMVSIWGANFCSSQTTFPAVGTVAAFTNGGCASTTILPGIPDTTLYRFPFSLTPDQYITPAPPSSALWRYVTVNFYLNGSTTPIPAPLLFATNGQINTIVPGALTTGQTYNVVVSFGCAACTPSTVVSSAPFPVSIVPADPGIFTIGADGQGPAAALASGTYALISGANPAGMRYTASDSDTVQIYMTGLGVPAAGAAYNSNTGACIGALGNGYLTALNDSVTPNQSLTNIDGDVLLDSLFPGDLPPCLTTEPTVTIGGVPTPVVSYTAFTGDTVAGLYQINVPLPSTQNTFKPNFPSTAGEFTNLTAPTQLPVLVTLNGVTSQAGVMLSVAPRLKMSTTGISAGTTTTLSIGHAIASTTITGSNNGVSTGVKYAVTSGVLPQGLTLTYTSPGGVATIAGTPAQGTAGTYPITITATDTSAVPITGTVSFTYYVPGGLYVTASAPTVSTYNTANAAIATVTAVGGTAPYSQFAITSSPTLTGMSITSGGVLQTDGTTPAGTYMITVTATDAAGVTGTVNITFVVNLALSLSPASPITVSDSDVNAITTVTALGGSSTYTYTIDAASTPNAQNLSFTGNALYVGTALTGANMTVIIDVVDSGAPPAGGTLTVAPAQITLTLTLN